MHINQNTEFELRKGPHYRDVQAYDLTWSGDNAGGHILLPKQLCNPLTTLDDLIELLNLGLQQKIKESNNEN